MKVIKTRAILALFLSAMSLSGCSGGTTNSNIPLSTTTSNSDTNNANATKTNVEELGLLVNIPYEALDIVWKQDTASKKVVAVLRFSTEDANKIVAESEKFGPSQNVSLSVETWFPDELTAQGEMSGDSSLKGLTYPANAFYLAPYTSGRITRIERGDFFVLVLNAQ